MKKFINYCYNSSIPVIVCSSGYKKIIELILNKNGIKYTYLLANNIDCNFFNVISPNNKDKFVKRLIFHEKLNSNNYLLIGEQEEDSEMIKYTNKKTVKIIKKCDKDKKSNFDYIIIGE